MSRLLIFVFIASLGVVAVVALFAIESESWNGDHPHKVQYGLFPFWQTTDNGGIHEKSSSGPLYKGIVETALAAVSISTIVYISWVKLIRAALKKNDKMNCVNTRATRLQAF
jgi:hypothetical protein